MEKKGDEERKERGQSTGRDRGPPGNFGKSFSTTVCGAAATPYILTFLPQFLPETAVFGPLPHVFSYVRTVPRIYTRREEREKCMKKRESDVRK